MCEIFDRVVVRIEMYIVYDAGVLCSVVGR